MSTYYVAAYTYTAEHRFQFRLDRPVTYGALAIDTIQVEIEWADADNTDDSREGWLVSGHFYGWPLTKAGHRDKRIKTRESAHFMQRQPFPIELWGAVSDVWTISLKRAGINGIDVVNPGEGLFNPARYAAAA